MNEGKDNWEMSWDARMAGFESHFGKCDENVLHATIPFQLGFDLGGSPDVVTFSSYTNGQLYITSDLLGSEQKPNSHGQYELAVVHQGEENWGVEIICSLAYYTLENVIDHGETMDIAEAVPEGSTIAAIIFRRIANFKCLGSQANVLCCIGITYDELNFCLEHGSEDLFKRFPKDYVLTDMYRKSHLGA